MLVQSSQNSFEIRAQTQEFLFQLLAECMEISKKTNNTKHQAQPPSIFKSIGIWRNRSQ